MKRYFSVKFVMASLGLLLCFGISYYLCRYTFFDIHGMNQWPNCLALFGLIVLLISIFFKLWWLSITTTFGYIIGFALGVVFNTDGVDYGGARTNNLWKIWTVTYLLCIVIGIIVHVVMKINNKVRLRNKKG